MGKKKKNKQQAGPTVDPEKQKEAVRRLAALFAYAARPPEKILSILERLEIPYETKDLNSPDSYLMIRLSDLEAGEARNQDQGSFMTRLEKVNVDALPL